jgi:hypothetical protein
VLLQSLLLLRFAAGATYATIQGGLHRASLCMRVVVVLLLLLRCQRSCMVVVLLLPLSAAAWLFIFTAACVTVAAVGRSE